MSTTLPAAAPELGAEHFVSEVLEACGCGSVAVRVAGTRMLAPGCAVSLQFGDEVAEVADGGICLTIRGGIKINGAADYTVGATRWQVRMPERRLAASDQLSVTLEADLILANDVTIAEGLARGREAYRELRLLIADARDTLAELNLERAASDAAPGPALRLEARLFGDLICGRSGLVAGRTSAISARHRRIMNAACDWLAQQALPDLARAVRAVIRQVGPSPVGAARADLARDKAQPHRRPQDCESGGAGDPSIVPALEPIR
jgi:hypothetical protein